MPRARVGWHTARTLLPPPPPRSSGAPVRWLMARGRRASGVAAAPRSRAAGAPATPAAGAPWEARARAARVQTAGEEPLVVVVVVVPATPNYLGLASLIGGSILRVYLSDTQACTTPGVLCREGGWWWQQLRITSGWLPLIGGSIFQLIINFKRHVAVRGGGGGAPRARRASHRASVNAAGARYGGGRHLCSARTRDLTGVAVSRRRTRAVSTKGEGPRCNRSWHVAAG